MNDPDKSPIVVNEILGKQASFGGVIPANQILPWILIVTLSYFIFDGILGWGIPTVGALSFWLVASWWMLTGKDPDSNFINLFRHPKRDWATGGAVYISPLLSRQQRHFLKQKARKIRR